MKGENLFLLLKYVEKPREKPIPKLIISLHYYQMIICKLVLQYQLILS